MYKDQEIWKQINALLPSRNQIDELIYPEEEFWEWNENFIHIDAYRNREAKVKIILLYGVGGNGRQ